MKQIIINPYSLKEKEITQKSNKARALIITEENMVLINYADVLMFPGGKIEKDEANQATLIRELKEELGLHFNNQDLTPLITIKNFQKDYPSRKNNKSENKIVCTNYFLINGKEKLKFNQENLSEKEKENKFQILTIPLKNIIPFIQNFTSNNPRCKYFQEELLVVLRFYLKNIVTNKNNLVDLHTHSIYSDGDLSPEELINLAKSKNIKSLAITDHDTINGNLAILEKGFFQDQEIQIIPGIELSAKVPKGRMHILGYDIDLKNKELNKKMKELENNSINSVLSIIEQIKRDYGIIFTYQELKELVNATHNLGRPDIAKLIVKNGYAKTIQEAFDLYLIDAHQKTRGNNKGLSYQECLNLILNSGGIPVLAHPHSLELNEKELLLLIKEMINNGLQGIEVYHSNHTKEQTKLYLEIARKYNLLISGGTDYHGKSVKPDIELGTGRNNNVMIRSLSILNHLKTK